MSPRFLLGLDFGGGCGRCLALDLDTGTLTTAARSWSFSAHPENPTAFDIDLDQAWALLADATRETLARTGAAPEDVAGIAATSMRHGSVVIDANGETLLAAPNRDARGLGSILALGDRSEDFFRRTGHWPNPVQPAGRLMWMAAEQPERFARADAHLSISDWIGFRLSGERASEASQACETLLFDLAKRDWDDVGIDALNLPRSLFPALRNAGESLGGLLEGPARDLGLAAGTPVAVGGADTQCGLLGAGVTTPGQLGAVVGTTAPLQRVFDHPILDDGARLWSVHHAVPGLFALESNAGGVGEALDWIAGALYAESPHPVQHLIDEAERSEAGAAGVFSNLGAEVMNARQLAPPVGNITLCPLGSARDPKRRRHLARAIVEGMVFALRANAEQIERSAGVEATTLHLGGGLSRSPLFAQLASDVFAQPVVVARSPETSALGAAICAGVAAEVFDDLATGAAALATPRRIHTPDPEQSPRYAELFESWETLRGARAAGDAAAMGWVMRGLFA
jgi:sugar (pentulose or hexulose) kinase